MMILRHCKKRWSRARVSLRYLCRLMTLTADNNLTRDLHQVIWAAKPRMETMSWTRRRQTVLRYRCRTLKRMMRRHSLRKRPPSGAEARRLATRKQLTAAIVDAWRSNSVSFFLLTSTMGCCMPHGHLGRWLRKISKIIMGGLTALCLIWMPHSCSRTRLVASSSHNSVTFTTNANLYASCTLWLRLQS